MKTPKEVAKDASKDVPPWCDGDGWMEIIEEVIKQRDKEWSDYMAEKERWSTFKLGDMK